MEKRLFPQVNDITQEIKGMHHVEEKRHGEHLPAGRAEKAGNGGMRTAHAQAIEQRLSLQGVQQQHHGDGRVGGSDNPFRNREHEIGHGHEVAAQPELLKLQRHQAPRAALELAGPSVQRHVADLFQALVKSGRRGVEVGLQRHADVAAAGGKALVQRRQGVAPPRTVLGDADLCGRSRFESRSWVCLRGPSACGNPRMLCLSLKARYARLRPPAIQRYFVL